MDENGEVPGHKEADITQVDNETEIGPDFVNDLRESQGLSPLSSDIKPLPTQEEQDKFFDTLQAARSGQGPKPDLDIPEKELER